MNHLELVDLWNSAHAAWAKGEARPSELDGWYNSYSGTRAHAPDPMAMPEPWIGDLLGNPEVVTMGIHAGAADAAFHRAEGKWANAIAEDHGGSFSSWAATGAYFGAAWESANGANAHTAQRQRFLSAWTGREVAPSQVVEFALYPWHIDDWSGAAFRPRAADINQFVLEPIAASGARWAFGFGKDWWNIIEELGLPVLDQLGIGGRPYPTQVDHRRWMVVQGPGGLRIAVMRLDGMPTPPKPEETEQLRRVLENGPAGDDAPRRVPTGVEDDLAARLRELELSQLSIWRVWSALEQTELSIDAWHEDPDGGVALSADGETVVNVRREWADFLTVQPSDSTEVAEQGGVYRLPLLAVAKTTTRTVRKEPKPLGMCPSCFNVLNPDGTCPMECDD